MKTAADMTEEELVVRNELIELHIDLAIDLAKRRYRTVHKTVQFGDLLSAAYLGLIDAATKYDADKANKESEHPFPAYARPRINGEMNDYLRSCNWGTRNNPQKIKSLDITYEVVGDFEKPIALKDMLISQERQAIDYVNSPEIFDKLIRGLPKTAKEAFRLRYCKDLTMKETADLLGLSESRVSQILSQHTKFLHTTWEKQKCDLWEEASTAN